MQASSSFTSACLKEVASQDPGLLREGRKEEAAASLQIMGASKGCRGVGRGHTLVCVQDDLMLSTTSASPHPRDAEQPVSVVCLLLSPQGWGGAEPGREPGSQLLQENTITGRAAERLPAPAALTQSRLSSPALPASRFSENFARKARLTTLSSRPQQPRGPTVSTVAAPPAG